jgi:hypothetical protein
MARKRKSGELPCQEKRKQEKKTERGEKRVKNFAEEKDVVQGEPIQPIEHLKEEFTKDDRRTQE